MTEQDKILPASTAEVFARLHLDLSLEPGLIAWAEAMVEAGFESDTLYILLGEVPPFNVFELRDLVMRIGKELGVPSIGTHDEAVEAITLAEVERVRSHGTDALQGLSNLRDLYIEENMPTSLQDFYLLYWANDDLRHMDVQHYLDGVDRSNIRAIIRKTFREWKPNFDPSEWHSFEWHAALSASAESQ